jgi:hypothetical protein
MSFTIAQTGIFFFLDWARRLIKSVVFPEPRKPLSITIGTLLDVSFKFLM